MAKDSFHLPLSTVRARHQAALFAHLCDYRPESFRPLINATHHPLFSNPSLLADVTLDLSPRNLTRRERYGSKGGPNRRLHIEKDLRPIPPFSGQSYDSRLLARVNGIELPFELQLWCSQFPGFEGLGWPISSILLFVFLLAKGESDFDLAISKFKSACLDTAYGPVDKNGKRSYVETARQMKRISLYFRPPTEDFVEATRLALTADERKAARKMEMGWLTSGTGRFRLWQEAPPCERHESWGWLIAWVEGRPSRDIGLNSEKASGGDERTVRNALEGRVGKPGGLLHYTGLLVNGQFPAKL